MRAAARRLIEQFDADPEKVSAIALVSLQSYDGFTRNKYFRWYESIITQYDSGDSLERHHIIPKSLGGGDIGNIIILSYRKHFLAHWLLTKFTSGADQKKMRYALWCMSRRGHKGRQIRSSWQYAVAAEAKRVSMLGAGNASFGKPAYARGKTLSAEHRAKISAANKGRSSPFKGIPRSPEIVAKVLAANVGNRPSEAAKVKMRLAKLGRKMSDCDKQKRRSALLGVPKSEAHKANISAGRRAAHLKNKGEML